MNNGKNDDKNDILKMKLTNLFNKKVTSYTAGFISFLLLVLITSCHRTSSNRYSVTDLENQFSSPLFQYAPCVFWQWMNGNITREGITRDLEAMHEAGIKGGIIFNNAVGVPRGSIDYGSDEWIDMTVFAFEEANRLGMEFMIHNSPGYTSTGGPWITPEYSMQQVVWSESFVSGPGEKELILPQPYAKMDWYKDAIVIAYPSLEGEDKPMRSQLKAVIVNGTRVDKSNLVDFSYETKVEMKIQEGKDRAEMVLVFEEPFEARSILIRREKTAPPSHPYDGARDNPPGITLEYSNDGKIFERIASIPMPAQRELEIPTVQNFRAVRARYFRLLCNKETNITDLELVSFLQIEGLSAKANFLGGNTRFPGNTNKLDFPFAIDKNQIVDLSKYMSEEGKLTWNFPEGKWTVLRIGHTTTGEQQVAAPDACRGLECDKLSKTGVDEHYNKFLKKVFEKSAPFIGKSFIGLAIDSWEVGVQNWTAGFEDEFSKRNSYSLVPYIVSLTGRYVGNIEETDQFLWDFRKTQEDMLAENYYLHFKDLCHKNGLILAAEPYGDGKFNNWQVGKNLDIVLGEFWVHGLYGGPATNRNAGYIAHTNGLRIAGAEAFTAMPDMSKFTEYPSAMKADGDWMFTLGINQLYFHTSAHQSHPDVQPGLVMGPFGTHFNRNNNWLIQAKPWFDYLRRCQFMLQKGLFVADACLFTGEDGGGFPLMETGFAFDIIGKDVLLTKSDVKDEKLVLPDGMSYPALIIPDRVSLSTDVLKKIKTLVSKGLWVASPKPNPVSGLKSIQTRKEWEQLVDEMWGAEGNSEVTEKTIGKGKLFYKIRAIDLLQKLNLDIDFFYTSDDPNAFINYIHRKIGSADYYFVANSRRNDVSITTSFRIDGKQPELWHPETGEIYPLMVYKSENNRTTIPLDLKPSESVFIVFRDKAKVPPYEKIMKDEQVWTDVIAENPLNPLISDLTNNFTIECWVKPDVIAFGNRGFLLYPYQGEKLYVGNHASVGLTVGQNGFRVFEQSGPSPVMVLNAEKKIEGWTHLALTYRNGKPEVLLNGEKCAEGKVSGFTVHPNMNVLADINPLIVIFQGENTKLTVHPTALIAREVKAIYEQGKPFKQSTKSIKILKEGDRQTALFGENGTYKFYSTGAVKEISVNEILPEIGINTPWTVRFHPKKGAPDEIQLVELKSLHKHDDFGVRHFSGTATYISSFDVQKEYFKPDSRLVIDLGDVSVIAEVIVNGTSIGHLWKPPFEADISKVIHGGKNNLEIRVNNLWVNRLIGDEYLPEENQYDPWGEISEMPQWFKENKEKPGERITYVVWKQYDKNGPLVESGLGGPVKLKMLIKKNL